MQRLVRRLTAPLGVLEHEVGTIGRNVLLPSVGRVGREADHFGRAVGSVLQDVDEAAQSSFLSRVLQHKKALIFIAVVAIAVAVPLFKNFFLTLFLMALGAVSMIYKRKHKEAPIGIELVTFGTVICGMAYGPAAGALFGLVTAVMAQLLSSAIDVGMVFFFAAAMLMGFVAGNFPDANVVVVGVAMALLMDALVQSVVLLTGASEQRLLSLVYIAVHLLFNVLVFNVFGNAVLSLARLG